MVLRKPLAFLIKHFKFIHFLLAAICIYLIYKTSSILVFFNEYMASSATVLSTQVAGIYVTPFMCFLILVMLLGSTLILTILRLKEKPTKFYIYHIFAYVIVLAIFLYSYTILETLEDKLLEIQTLELCRDLIMISILLQNVSLMWLGIRAVGFDIKSFHFNENLDELQIDEKDNEEFEVDLDVDKHVYTRYYRKMKRFIRYMVKENKLLVTLSILIVIGISCYIVYLNHGVYEEELTLNQTFRTNEFIINIENSYYTNTDYKNNILKEDTGFVILRINVKNATTLEKVLKTGRFSLLIGDYTYHETTEYKDKFIDLGITYLSQPIIKEGKTYLLTFPIADTLKNKKMILKYMDTNDLEININVTPFDLTQQRLGTTISVTGDMDFSETPLKKSILNIREVTFANEFKIPYQYCYDEKCYDSYEYIKSSDKTSKTLVKLIGTLNVDESLNIGIRNDIHKLIGYYGSFIYKKNGQEKKVTGNFKRVYPTKTKGVEEYYIEVDKEVLTAEEVSLVLNMRGYIYTYRLK